MDPLKMYFLLKMGIFHGYVSLPEGNWCYFMPISAVISPYLQLDPGPALYASVWISPFTGIYGQHKLQPPS